MKGGDLFFGGRTKDIQDRISMTLGTRASSSRREDFLIDTTT